MTIRRKDSGMGVDPEGYVPDYSPVAREAMGQPSPTPVIQQSSELPSLISRAKSFVNSPQSRQAASAANRQIQWLNPVRKVADLAVERYSPVAGRKGLAGVAGAVRSDVGKVANRIGSGINRAATGLLYGKEGLEGLDARTAQIAANLEAAREERAKRDAATQEQATVVAPTVQPSYRVTGINADAPEYEVDGVQVGRMAVNNAVINRYPDGTQGTVGGVMVRRPDGTMAEYSPEAVAGMALAPNTESPIFRGMGTGVVGAGAPRGISRLSDPDRQLGVGLRSWDSQRPSKEERVVGVMGRNAIGLAREQGASQERVAGIGGGVQRDVAGIQRGGAKDVAEINAKSAEIVAKYGVDVATANRMATMIMESSKQQQAERIARGNNAATENAAKIRAGATTKADVDAQNSIDEAVKKIIGYDDVIRRNPGWTSSQMNEAKLARDQEVAALAAKGYGPDGRKLATDGVSQGGKIRITRNGQSGTIDPKDFNPATDQRV